MNDLSAKSFCHRLVVVSGEVNSLISTLKTSFKNFLVKTFTMFTNAMLWRD